jgi:molybdopterin-binding protein
MRMSARNQLSGSVVDVTSSITKEAADELGLTAGTDVVVIVKASDVILAIE